MNSNWSYSPETPNLGQNLRFLLSRVTLKFNRWRWKPIGHLFYATQSFVHYFVAIGEFKLEFQSGKFQIWVKIVYFFSSVTLKFDGWPWKTIGHLSKATSSFVHHFITICELKLELQSQNGWIGCWPLWPWRLTYDLHLLHGHHFCHWL